MNERFMTQWTAGSMHINWDISVDALGTTLTDPKIDVSKKASGNRPPAVG